MQCHPPSSTTRVVPLLFLPVSKASAPSTYSRLSTLACRRCYAVFEGALAERESNHAFSFTHGRRLSPRSRQKQDRSRSHGYARRPNDRKKPAVRVPCRLPPLTGADPLWATAGRGVDDAQDKVDNSGQHEDNGQERGTEAVVETGLAAPPYRLGTPVVGEECIQHGHESDAREQESRDERRAVTKVEHADGEGAEDDGKVHP